MSHVIIVLINKYSVASMHNRIFSLRFKNNGFNGAIIASIAIL